MDFFRVCNWNPAAGSPADNGHPLFVWPAQGGGRVDDPLHEYRVLYVGSDPVGAVAEAFGRFPRWTPAVLDAPPSAPAGTVKALVRYRGDPAVLDLDDPVALARLGLRPSQVVNRDLAVTQGWARRIFEQGRYAGASWWSFYGPQWASFGLWDWSRLEVADAPRPLSLSDPDLVAAAEVIVRPVAARAR